MGAAATPNDSRRSTSESDDLLQPLCFIQPLPFSLRRGRIRPHLTQPLIPSLFLFLFIHIKNIIHRYLPRPIIRKRIWIIIQIHSVYINIHTLIIWIETIHVQVMIIIRVIPAEARVVHRRRDRGEFDRFVSVVVSVSGRCFS